MPRFYRERVRSQDEPPYAVYDRQYSHLRPIAKVEDHRVAEKIVRALNA